MNQIHPKSQTTQVLHQEPIQKMRTPFIKGVVSAIQNISLFAIVAAAFTFTSLTILRGCADDVNHQKAMAIKHQLQSGGVK